VPDAHPDPAGHLRHPQVGRGVGVDEVLGGAYRRAPGRRGPGRRGELALPTRTTHEHQQLAGDLLGELGPVVGLDEGERQVDPGGHPARGPDAALPQVDRVGVHGDGGVLAGQRRGRAPVRGRGEPVEHTRPDQAW